MRKTMIAGTMALAVALLTVQACKRKPDEKPGLTAYKLDIPSGLPAMEIPEDNPLTEEGVALGRRLFYDPLLSGDNTMSCGSCHKQAFAFSDSSIQFSVGIAGAHGLRNAMPITNLGWQQKFFWDGGAADLESQVIGPIENHLEMKESLPHLVEELNAHKEYPALFEEVFGTRTITIPKVMKAIAQFERTLISGNSKWDQYKRGTASLTAAEARGRDVFEAEDKGDCTHCHSLGSTFSDFEFRNTGLDSISIDPGRAAVTGFPTDSGKFKTPSLRNIALTAPYMHDGRFKTLEECIEHYDNGFFFNTYIDGNIKRMKKHRMNAQEKADLLAFLHTLTDHEFIKNPKFAKP